MTRAQSLRVGRLREAVRALRVAAVVLLCTGAAVAQERVELTPAERIDYHQRIERARQAQITSLSKQVAAQQQIRAGYQQASQGLLALLAGCSRGYGVTSGSVPDRSLTVTGRLLRISHKITLSI